jgi:hypothetical protein
VTVSSALNACATTPDAGGWHYWLVFAVCLLWGGLMFVLITFTGKRGRWWLSALGVYLASAIPLLLITTRLEDRSIRPLLGWHGSWALQLLDLIVVPLMIALCSVGWPRLPQSSPRRPDKPRFWRLLRWWLISAGIGLALALAFHVSEAGAYDVYRFHSLSKTLHDIGSYGALMAATIYLGIPILANPRLFRWLWLAILALVGVAVFLLWHEAVFHLAPAVYHPQAMWGSHWGQVFHCSVT